MFLFEVYEIFNEKDFEYKKIYVGNNVKYRKLMVRFLLCNKNRFNVCVKFIIVDCREIFFI